MDERTMKLYGLLVILEHAANNSPAMPIGDFCPSIAEVKTEFEATAFADLPSHDCMGEGKLVPVVQIGMTDDKGNPTGTKSLEMCQVCGRRHWSMEVQPIVTKLEGSPLG